MRVSVYSHGTEFSGQFPQGTTLLAAIRALGVEIESPCNGLGKCGKCRVRVDDPDTLSKPTPGERKLLGEALNAGIRLACRAKPIQDCRVHLDCGTYTAIANVEDTSFERIEPLLRRYRLVLSGRVCEGDLLSEFLRESGEIELDTSNFYIDPFKEEVFLYTKPGKLVAVTNRKGANLGIAIDLGTTTIAAVLVDLDDGSVLARRNTMNPQRRFGHDVISRITHTITVPEGSTQLTRLIRDSIDSLLGDLCEYAQCRREEINQLVLAGNTTMTHLLLGFPVRSIALAPFSPFYKGMVWRPARDLGFEVSPFAEVLTLPALSSYIGGDIVADILATRLERSEGELLIDLGTNGEIVFSMEGRLLCCSTAAGPAFEGGSISSGTGNLPGAVERVRFDGRLILETIGSRSPVGICGSGLISLVATLLRNGVLEASGKFSNPASWPNGLAKLFDTKEKRLILVEGLTVTLKDLREFQLAKAAVRAGIETLIGIIGRSKLKRIRIAGGFSGAVEADDLFRTGILPGDLEVPVLIEGNSSLKGALETLLYRESLDRINEIQRSSEYIELSSLAEFEELYASHMGY